MKLFSDWRESIVKPLVLNVLTAGVLFALALAFKPVLQGLLSAPEVAQYPLVCFAEPHSGPSPDQRFVDFYVVNLRDQAYTRSDLADVLRLFNPDPDRALSPDLDLEMRGGEGGKVVAAEPDTEFNRGKGQILVTASSNGRNVRIRVDQIEPRAFMRVTLHYAGMLPVPVVERMAKILVPFKFDDLQNRCFRT